MGKKKRPRGRPDSIEVFDTEGLTQARRYAQQGLKINEIAEKFSMSKASLMRAQARTDNPRGPKLKRFLDIGRYHKGDPLGTTFLWIYEQLERLDDVVENEFGDLPFFLTTRLLLCLVTYLIFTSYLFAYPP